MDNNERQIELLNKLLDSQISVLVEDKSGPLCYMGCNYRTEIDIAKISDLIVGIELEKKKAIKHFDKLYKDECRDYISCSRHIKRVLHSVTALFLDGAFGLIIRYALLEKENLSEFRETYNYYSNAIIYAFISELDDIVEEIADDYNIAADELIGRYEDSEMNFIGGGRGVSGLIGGMVVAGAAKGVSDIIRNVHYTGKAYKLKNMAEETFETLFISDEAYESYVGLITLIEKEFIEESLQQILPEGMRLDMQDDLLKLLDSLTRKIDDEVLREVSKKLFCKFPLDKNTYIFISNNYINCEKENNQYITKYHIDFLSKIDFIFKRNQLAKLDVDFPCNESISSYCCARDLYEKECKADLQKNIVDYRNKEYSPRFLFRIIFKQALASMEYCENLCNKYAYELLGEKNTLLSYDVMAKCKNKYVIISNQDLMILEDSLVVYDSTNKKSILYDYEKINGLFLTFTYEKFRTRKENPKLIVVDKEGGVYEYKVSNDWEKISYIVDATNFSINRIKSTDDIYYKDSEGFNRLIHAYCYACRKLVWVKDSGKSYIPDYCGKCGAHEREMRYVLYNKHYKLLLEQCTMENFIVSLQDNINFNDENMISKNWSDNDWEEFEHLLNAEAEEKKRQDEEKKKNEAKKQIKHKDNYDVNNVQRNVSAESVNIASIKYCAFCGKKIIREAKFCNYCGKQTVN